MARNSEVIHTFSTFLLMSFYLNPLFPVVLLFSLPSVLHDDGLGATGHTRRVNLPSQLPTFAVPLRRVALAY
jgi:hypothetical protein